MRRRILLSKTSGGGGEDIIYDGVDLGLTGDSANVIWATANVGASAETEYGEYYQWGSLVPYEYKNQYWTGTTDLPLSADTAAMLMKGDWRMPNSAESKTLLEQTTSAWTTNFNGSGVDGYKLTSKNNTNKYVFLPAAGHKFKSSTAKYVGSEGVYWQTNSYESGSRTYAPQIWFSSPDEWPPDGMIDYRETDGDEIDIGRSVRAVKPKYHYVDLGLPSGLKWATANVGAVKETDCGTYFKYGAGNEHYFLDMSNNHIYYGTENPLAASADTATVCMGEGWRTPTSGECQELIDNTTYQWVTNFNGSGVSGGKFIASNGNYIFFPISGWYDNTEMGGLESTCLWTSTPGRIGYSVGYFLNIYEENADISYIGRMFGQPVRGVYDAKIDGYEYVDFGLPSGNKWATMNVGASSETDYGNYYQYGAGATTYQNTNQYYTGTTNPLPSRYDTATQVMGGGWYTPTRADFQELINYTTYTNLTINGVYCGKFISKTDSSKFLIIPAGGRYVNGSLLYANQEGLLWSSTPLYSPVYSLEFYVGTRGLSTDYDRKLGANIRGVHK